MIGSILGGAFRLVRQRPFSVTIWAIVYLVGIFAIGLLRGLMTPPGASGATFGNCATGPEDAPCAAATGSAGCCPAFGFNSASVLLKVMSFHFSSNAVRVADTSLNGPT